MEPSGIRSAKSGQSQVKFRQCATVCLFILFVLCLVCYICLCVCVYICFVFCFFKENI